MNYISKIISIQLKSKLQSAIITLLFILVFSIDNSGMGIGFHTSRIGYAESTDGINFKRISAPVLYPGNDFQKEFEWPGGCEDPRVAATQNGLYVLFYNGKNKSGEDGDMRYSPDSYCEGQVLFDSKDPSKPITRLDVPFLRPMESFKKSGQYANGTVFKGMAFFKKKWHLYYGCADSRVGVAIYDPSVHAPPDPIILNRTS